MHSPRFQLADFISAAAEISPELPCFRFEDGSSRTFAETEARVSRLATALQARGIGKGDRIAILSLDKAEYIETLFACTMIGAAFVPLNNRLRTSELRILLEAAAPSALFVSARYAELVPELSEGLATVSLSVCYDGTSGLIAFEDLLAEGQPVRPRIEIDDSDCAAIVFTSGTTGRPKAAMQSQKALKSTFTNALVNFELSYEGCGYSGSPLFHVAGYGIAFANLVSRSASLVMPQFDPAAVLACIDKGYVTHCLFVPTMVTMLLDHPDCAATSFGGLETILYGAAPMSPSLLRRAIEKFGCNFVQLFGAATETGTQLTLTSKDHKRALAGAEHLLGSVGRPGLAVRMRIVDADGNEVPVGTVGEIVTQSDQTMIGYLDRPDETARAIRNGWFWGGDLGVRDAEGYVYLSGRSKDMIIRGGENIYPVEIETVMSGIPGIVHVSVIGEPDDHWGETVLACIMVNDDFAGIEHALSECGQQLARFKVPARIEILSSMPLTASGKISKPTLREAGREGRHEAYGARTELQPA